MEENRNRTTKPETRQLTLHLPRQGKRSLLDYIEPLASDTKIDIFEAHAARLQTALTDFFPSLIPAASRLDVDADGVVIVDERADPIGRITVIEQCDNSPDRLVSSFDEGVSSNVLSLLLSVEVFGKGVCA